MSNLALKVENVSKSFKINHEKHERLRDYFINLFNIKSNVTNFQALKGIDFDVKKGEFVGIIGRNGSGKSTLLKIIAGIYLPDTGKVEVDGHLIPFLELGVGFNMNLTARENVFLNGIILGMTRKEVQKKYDEIIDFAGVKEFEDMQLKRFSSGMQVRLAFSIAVQAPGDIYLLDEVFAVGDIGFQEKSLKVIEQMIADKKTIIFVTHDLKSIEDYCDRCIVIDNHEIAFSGDPKEAVEFYKNLVH